MKAAIQTRHQTDRTILKDVLPIDTPFAIGIWTGDVCNLKCKYCVQALSNDKFRKTHAVKNFLSWDIFERIAEQISEFPIPIKTVAFSATAGEPLMNKNLTNMIRRLKETNKVKTITMFTNGLLLTKRKSLELIDSGLDRINISLQGINSEAYKQMCGADIDIQKLQDNFKFLYENKKQCHIFMKTLDICLKEGEEKLFYDMFGNYCDTIYINNAVRLYQGLDYTGVISEAKGVYNAISNKHDVCSMSFYSIYTQADGCITPCCTMPFPIDFGNVTGTTLYSAFNGEKRRKFLLMMLERKRHNHPTCGSCIAPDNGIICKEDDLDPYAEELRHKFLK